MKEEKCCAGCRRLTGDETYHIPECYFYEGSMSRMYDETCKELKELKDKYRWRRSGREMPESTIGSSGANRNETDHVLVKLCNGEYSIDKRVYIGLNNATYSWFWYNYTNKEVIEWKPID